MPNRILHERICVSETLAQLTAEEERFFYRLIVQCDDYGRFDGRPAVIRSRCFALQLDTVSDEDIASWLTALESVGLIVTYTVRGRVFLRVTTWASYQQTRAKKSKFPAPEARENPESEASDSIGYQTLADVPVNREREALTGNEKREAINEKREREAAAPPRAPGEKPSSSKLSEASDPPETLEPTETDYQVGEAAGLSRGQVDQAAAAMLDHWRARGEQRADWHAALRKWLRDEERFRGPPGRASPSEPTLSRASAQRVNYLKAE